jgi:hypothetical protein
MNFSSIIVIIASSLGTAAKAQESSISQIKLQSNSRESLFKASAVIGKFVSSVRSGNYKIEFNSEKNAAKILIEDSSSLLSMDHLIDQIYMEFGNSIKVEKVQVLDISLGSQDGWM